jgi:hypothetical protein
MPITTKSTAKAVARTVPNRFCQSLLLVILRTSPNIIGVLSYPCFQGLLRNSVEFHIDSERNLASFLSAVGDAPL